MMRQGAVASTLIPMYPQPLLASPGRLSGRSEGIQRILVRVVSQHLCDAALIQPHQLVVGEGQAGPERAQQARLVRDRA